MFDFMKIFFLLELLNIYKLFPHRLTVPSLTAPVSLAPTAIVLSNSTSTNAYHLSPHFISEYLSCFIAFPQSDSALGASLVGPSSQLGSVLGALPTGSSAVSLPGLNLVIDLSKFSL